MKRGFLNSAKAKARPRKSEPAAKFSGSASIDHSNFKPVGVDIYTEPCNFGNRIRAADMTFKLSLFTLPMGARLDGPVSECLFFSGSKEVLTSMPSFPQSLVHRAAAIAFTPKVFDWAVNRALSNDWLIDECRKQLALIAREGLEHRAEQYVATLMIMYAYICLGDGQRASEWAAEVDKFPWEEENVENIGALLDPATVFALKAQ